MFVRPLRRGAFRVHPSTIFNCAGNRQMPARRQYRDGILRQQGGENWAPAAKLPISPLVGEMPGRAEGGAVPPTLPVRSPIAMCSLVSAEEQRWRPTAPLWPAGVRRSESQAIGFPSAARAAPHPPRVGEIGSFGVRAYFPAIWSASACASPTRAGKAASFGNCSPMHLR
ncbi:MAG: hypothetical protein E5Y12_11095 [Mesorhizobium sp.]|nr:MAG: hypothetical protein E5Y12_11095 [Mesorhizobium sp.]